MASYPVQYSTANHAGLYNPPAPGPVHPAPGDQVNHPPPGAAQQPTPQSQQQHDSEDSESEDEGSGSKDDDSGSGSEEEDEEPANPVPAQPLPYPNPGMSGEPQAAFIPMPGTESRRSGSQQPQTRETNASMVYDASNVHNQQQPHVSRSAGVHRGTAPNNFAPTAPVYVRSRRSFAEALAGLPILDEHAPATTAQHDPKPRAQKAQTNTGGHRRPFQDDETEDPDDEAEDVEGMLSQQGDVYGPPHGMADAAHTREAGNSSAPVLRRGPRKKGLKSWWKSLWVPVPKQSDQQDPSTRQKPPRKRLTKPRPQGASSGTRGGPGGEAASYYDDTQSFATQDVPAIPTAHAQYPAQLGGQSSSIYAPPSGNPGGGGSTQASRGHTEGRDCWCLHTPRMCTRRNHPVGLHICKNQRHRARTRSSGGFDEGVGGGAQIAVFGGRFAAAERRAHDLPV
ncbi:hypothetical protein LTR91_012527 [Friedmanniomyces endolithicus]|uniref:Uncharacterized protein n=1 Tax=Friedmanniomyces endolithicus TaxID=329885 RepID=A0AAN6QQR5_9PEZI|nr:hypothetical protein LTR57_005175 [Friedmanniomyces endolithicus]KAK0979621.1 hypothetical protein LTR91_012527 [Friedmanniomyces endolithicus]KAK0988812.1 hypothetical protein LTS01_009081 [Friedmanniomyces endolithicus]KAK1037694.1 hypothetical protein LTS16_012602 [Friedmanniomyces endolithicus]KAK1077408.1 hypothetical protein LTR33_008115 [Friedmanniomyces endolithicus]